MAEEQESAGAEQVPKQGGGLVRWLIIGVAVMLGMAIVGLVVFNFVLRPIMEGEDETMVESGPKVSELAVTVQFDEAYVSVVMPTKDVPASTLAYHVALECSNQATADLVSAHMPRFTDMVRRMHSHKTREELNDPMVEETIKRQIIQAANQILLSVQPEPDPKNEVTAVFHDNFFVQDML
jgi:flagellar basal body-associated protein FliL